MRAIFAKGNPGPYVIWGTRAETTLLHFSLLLFIAGGLIYLFNINRTVFYMVVWWVGWIIFLYAIATSIVFSEPESLLHTPLSPLALHIYLGISYVVFQICSWIPPLHGLRKKIEGHYRDLSDRYSRGILIAKRRETAATASEKSRDIDELILKRMLLTLDEDRELETFFDAIPGFCTSKLSALPLSSLVETGLRQALDRFLNRTFSSSLISESDRTGRLITCLNASHAALRPTGVSGILDNILNGHWDEALQSVEIGHALRLWDHSRDRDYDPKIRQIIARIVSRVREHDNRWTKLVEETFGVPNHVLRDSHCPDPLHVPVATSDAITSPTQPGDLPNPSPHQSTLGGSTTLRPAEETNTVTGLPLPPNPSTTGEIGETSQPRTAPFPIRSGLPSSDRSPQSAVTTAQSDTASHAPLFHPTELNKQQGPATGILSIVRAPAHVSASTTPLLTKSSATYEATAFLSKSSIPASSSDFSAPDSLESRPPPHDPPLPNPEPLLSGMSPKDPSDNATLYRSHPRKLVNNGSMYLANAVLQSLVHCPPFQDLFRDQGWLVDQREGGEAGGALTPLIDATVRFLDKERSSLTHQAARGKMKEAEDGKKESDGMHSFLSLATDVYDVMKEKRQFIVMRVRSLPR